MEFREIHDHVKGVPFIDPDRARRLYDHIIESRPTSCLELGFAYGTSSCYIAAALDELGAGHLTTVDIERAKTWFRDPSIEDLLKRTGLGKYVTVSREKLSYTWFLGKKIAESTKDGVCAPIFDFCFIDGAHNWTVDGLAFFLVDKLLKEGGWLLFDDLNWSYGMAGPDSIAKVEECGIPVTLMDEDERTAPHVGMVYELLVAQHPSYGDFIVEDGAWGWARKSSDPNRTLTAVEVAAFAAEGAQGSSQAGSLVRRAVRKLKRKIVR